MARRNQSSLGWWAAFALAAAALCPAARAAEAASAAEGKADYSPAEQLIFMGDQLHNLKPPATLHYSFRKSGSLEEAFADEVTVKLTAQPDGSCCASSGDFLSGARKVAVPPVENAKANPVILYFLERDIGDMHRLAKGQQNYFRKRVRMAIYNGADVKDVSLDYRGKRIAAREVDISPYLDDPVRSRYDKFARKRYSFWLSEAVPGGVYGIRTVMSDERSDAPPLIVEEMFIDGAEPAAARSTP